MAKEVTAAALAAQAESAMRAADEIELMAMVKQAAAEYGSDDDWSQLGDLPDMSTAEIDPDQVYRFLVDMVGEERAQQILVDATADAIEGGIDEMEGRAPTRQDIERLMRRISEQDAEDAAEGWDAGEWGSP